MEQEFDNYLISQGYAHNTAYQYKSAIRSISEHYSQQTNNNIDIFQITDQNIISAIALKYGSNGMYQEAGNTGHGTWRNAIARYSEFFIVYNNGTTYETDTDNEPTNPDINEQENQINFAYERDLQRTLSSQITKLFPKYKIYTNGIEYTIQNRRIDVLLEHIEDGSLLAVELKSGIADYRVFGQISMYIGLLKEKFPDKEIFGVIVAGSIDPSLQQACSTTDKVKVKFYRMILELEDA